MRKRPLVLVVVVIAAVLFGLSGCDVINKILGLNSPPVADAGSDQTVPPGTLVTLDATGSSDSDGDALTYSWSFVTTPLGSFAAIASSNQSVASFTADIVGIYQAQVSVSDGQETVTDTVKITASNTALTVPTNLVVGSPTATSLTITWDSVAGATSYYLYRDSSDTGTFTTQVYVGAATTYTNTGLTPDTIYWYKVKAHNSAGNSSLTTAESGQTSAQTQVIPAVPAAPTISGQTQTSLTINWVSQSDADSYILQRASDAGFTTNLVIVTPTNYAGTSFQNTGLTSGNTYYYRVAAKNAAGTSGYSGGTAGTTLSNTNVAPTAPTNPTPADGAVNVDPSAAIVFTWTASTDADADPITYDLYGAELGQPLILQAAGVATNSYTSYVGQNQTIQWYVVAKDDQGHSTAGAVWTFSTSAATGNQAPYFDIQPGASQTSISVGTQIQLFGHAVDPENDALTYSWVLYGIPGGSVATVQNPNMAGGTNATFTPDVAGYYYFYLQVDDTASHTIYGYVTVYVVAGGGGYGYGIQ